MVKQKVLQALSEVQGTFTRQDIQKQIWIAQGKDIKKFVNIQGNYGTNIQEWITQNLLKRSKKNTYEVTDEGRLYLSDRKLWMKVRRRKKKERREFDANKHVTPFNYLIGKTISSIRRIEPSECGNMGWNKCPLIINFSDGTAIIPQSDDEGNDGGALLYYDYLSKKSDIIYNI